MEKAFKMIDDEKCPICGMIGHDKKCQGKVKKILIEFNPVTGQYYMTTEKVVFKTDRPEIFKKRVCQELFSLEVKI